MSEKKAKVPELKFRKNCIDVVMILPSVEGSIAGEKGSATRISMEQIMDVDFMSGVFRTMWVALVKQDKQLNKIFEAHFRNEAIEQARAEKLFKKAQKRALDEELKNAGEQAEKVLAEAAKDVKEPADKENYEQSTNPKN